MAPSFLCRFSSHSPCLQLATLWARLARHFSLPPMWHNLGQQDSFTIYACCVNNHTVLLLPYNTALLVYKLSITRPCRNSRQVSYSNPKCSIRCRLSLLHHKGSLSSLLPLICIRHLGEWQRPDDSLVVISLNLWWCNVQFSLFLYLNYVACSTYE